MKLAVRIFAALVVLAGAVASFSSAASTQAAPSHQSVTASLPVPTCGPNMPWCGNSAVAR